jgi:autotransporter-associated beta strand protein
LTKSGAGKWILTGTNTYTGGTTIANGLLQIGAGAASGNIGNGNIINNGALNFNRSGILTVSGGITGTGALTNDGSGTVILVADNTYSGGTTINAGTLQIGNGGASGKLNAAQPVINNGTLVFNSSSNFTLNGNISGSGSLVKNGSGTLTLNGASAYTGTTGITNGNLFVNGVSASASTTVYNTGGFFRKFGGSGTLFGPLTLAGQLTTLAPGPAAGSIGTLTINHNLSFGGNVEIEVNKSLSQSNDLVFVGGALTNTWTGGFTPTLTVTNLGPALVAGDTFTVFSKPLQNGAVLSVTGAGATWVNNLAVDGSISVISATRPSLNFSLVGSSLQFSWNTSFGNFKLQSTTNILSNNWADYPGGGTSPVTVPIDVTKPTVFFRLISP